MQLVSARERPRTRNTRRGSLNRRVNKSSRGERSEERNDGAAGTAIMLLIFFPFRDTTRELFDGLIIPIVPVTRAYQRRTSAKLCDKYPVLPFFRVNKVDGDSSAERERQRERVIETYRMYDSKCRIEASIDAQAILQLTYK